MRRSAPLQAVLPAACALVFFAACAGTSDRRPSRLVEVERLTRQGDYAEAARLSVALLDDLSADSPYYEDVREAQRNVSLASGLDRSRSLLLAGDNEAALALLEELDVAHPGQLPVAAWLDRARTKLADTWFQEAREHQANEDFLAARDAYLRTLDYDPDHPLAPGSLEDLQRVVEYRAQLAKDYYNDGVRSLSDENLSEADWNFGKVPKFDRANERALKRRAEVNRVQARERADRAAGLAKDHRYAAAASEYRAASQLYPESELLVNKTEQMRVEAKADGLLSEGRFMLLRGEIDRGEATLREGAGLTAVQGERFEAALASVDDARVTKAYQLALDLEHDFRFTEAIEGYAEVLAARDFYLDTRTRIDTLRGYVEDAERLYAEAAATSDDEEKLELLRQIEIFWPEYRDLPEQIERLAKGAGS